MMRRALSGVLLVVPLLLLAPTRSEAWGHGGHGHFHSHFGGFVGVSPFFGVSPFWWGPDSWWWAPPPALGYGYGYDYGYWGPPAVGYAEPPVYIERGELAPTAYWYYCPPAAEYYPTVGTCPEPWVKVAPAPR